jgi:alkanesulfonate monooxygenase SsuD/methylene tetrahydromethanopterin reductase-like flavin-dependent oxidoreductase (luciferase family)
MLAVGADPVRVAWAIDRVRAVRERAGLDPLTMPIGAYVNAVCHPDVDVARTLIAGGLATFARFSVMDGNVRTPVDSDQKSVLSNLHQAYDMTHHTEVGSAQTSQLTTEFIDRFGIVGSATECIARFEELGRLGIDRFVVSGPTMGADRTQAHASAIQFASEVIPALREPTNE